MVKTVTKFAYLPTEISDDKMGSKKTVWFCHYNETLELKKEEHEVCHDCFNPHSLCDKSPKDYWVVLSRVLVQKD